MAYRVAIGQSVAIISKNIFDKPSILNPIENILFKCSNVNVVKPLANAM